MKNLFLLVVSFFIATICSAQVSLQANKEGIYKARPDSLEWVDVEITSHPEALRYNSKFSQAISIPGEKILAERSERTLRLKLLFKKEVEVKECFILYNNQTKNIDYIEADPVKKEKSSYLILFSIALILLMLISNILFKRGYNNAAAIIASIIAFTIAVAVNTFATIAFATIAILAAAIVAAAIAATIAANENYKVISIIFYILMAIYIVLLFI